MPKNMEPVFGFIKCPICGDLTRAGAYRCQACNSILKERKEEFMGTFSSAGRTPQAVQQQGQHNPKRPEQDWKTTSVVVPKSINAFSSESRQAANGGYTQQNSSVVKETKYAGVEAVRNDVFSSENRKVYGKQFDYKGQINTQLDTFSSEKHMQERLANEQNVKKVNEAPDKNPYELEENMGYMVDTGDKVEEYVAHDIFEFRKHRFGKRPADVLDILLIILVILVGVNLVVEQLFTSPKVPMVFDVMTYAFSAVTIASVAAIKLTWKKPVVYVMMLFVILYSLFMIIGLLVSNKPEYRFGMSGGWNNVIALEPLVVFMPMGGIDAVCGLIVIFMSNLYTLFEAYMCRGDNEFEAKQSTGEFMKTYRSRGVETDIVQRRADKE